MMRLAIVGAGLQGGNHARVAERHPGVKVTLVVDPDVDRARALAEPLGAAWTERVPAASEVDAAVVAVPTAYHHGISKQLLSAGIHVLLEKPVTTTAGQAHELVELAEGAGLAFLVGHVERFNPAVTLIPDLLDAPIHISAVRAGPWSGRITDDVVNDLMIHDIDLVLGLVGTAVQSVEAVGLSPRSGELDIAAALLRFDGAITVDLRASRIGQDKLRTLEITQRESVVRVDLVRQDVTVTRVQRSEFLQEGVPRYSEQALVQIPFISSRGEPLALQLSHFVAATQEPERDRAATRRAVQALEVAAVIRSRAMQRTPV